MFLPINKRFASSTRFHSDWFSYANDRYFTEQFVPSVSRQHVGRIDIWQIKGVTTISCFSLSILRFPSEPFSSMLPPRAQGKARPGADCTRCFPYRTSSVLSAMQPVHSQPWGIVVSVVVSWLKFTRFHCLKRPRAPHPPLPIRFLRTTCHWARAPGVRVCLQDYPFNSCVSSSARAVNEENQRREQMSDRSHCCNSALTSAVVIMFPVVVYLLYPLLKDVRKEAQFWGLFSHLIT